MKGKEGMGEGRGEDQGAVNDEVYISRTSRNDIIEDISNKKLTHAVLYPRRIPSSSTVGLGSGLGSTELAIDEQFVSYPGHDS